ncbi:MAG: 16S rRNA (cytosine(1402)-N(4))-methyltransferase RsmH [bacterium]|nr:16S rRNA (cytosine(1402)-N(4))-methyltransferase RsmH [bacterium]
MSHIPVLLHEVMDGLQIKPDDVVLDGTINGGGHSLAISKLLRKKGVIIGMDRDEEALKRSKVALKDSLARVILINDNFRNLDTALEKNGFKYADKILLDIGLSSDQLEDSGRGFSFQKDESLLMTFKAYPDENDVTAREIVNTWEGENIETIIYGFGEEKFAKRITTAIVARRKEKPIETTQELVEVIKKNVPRWYAQGRVNCATKTFQALRMAVNDELGALEQGLTNGVKKLKSGGRIAVISFHSLEDRLIKKFFKEKKEEGIFNSITKKPITPSREEVVNNKRSRSAKLRIAQKN